MIPLQDVELVKGKQLSHEFTPDESLDKTCLVKLKPLSEASVLQVRYITSGFTWAPSYKVVLTPESQVLAIEGHTTILNDSLDVTSPFDSLNLLAGVPSLEFSHVEDPISQKEQSVEQFLSSLGGRSRNARMAPAMSNNIMSNMMQQQAMPFAGNSDDNDDVQSSNADDLHVYTFTNIACQQNARTQISLFDKTSGIDYADVHEADIKLNASFHRSSNADNNEVDCYHSILFLNKSSVPWTTAPCLVTRGEDQQLVSQSSITYTPVNHEVKVKLTKALAVRVFHSEDKIERTSTKKRVLNHDYLQCVASGTILVKNQKASDVKLIIKIQVTGDLAETSIKPSKSVETSGTDLVNANRSVTFELKMKAGTTESIKYSRSYFMRN